MEYFKKKKAHSSPLFMYMQTANLLLYLISQHMHFVLYS